MPYDGDGGGGKGVQQNIMYYFRHIVLLQRENQNDKIRFREIEDIYNDLSSERETIVWNRPLKRRVLLLYRTFQKLARISLSVITNYVV